MVFQGLFMKQSIRLVAALLLAGIGFAEVMFGQGGGASESKFLTIGTISKIDLKSKSITIKDGTSSNLAGIGATGGDNAARQGRGNRGGGGVAVSGGGSRQGRRDGGGSAPSMPDGPSAPASCRSRA